MYITALQPQNLRHTGRSPDVPMTTDHGAIGKLRTVAPWSKANWRNEGLAPNHFLPVESSKAVALQNPSRCRAHVHGCYIEMTWYRDDMINMDYPTRSRCNEIEFFDRASLSLAEQSSSAVDLQEIPPSASIGIVDHQTVVLFSLLIISVVPKLYPSRCCCYRSFCCWCFAATTTMGCQLHQFLGRQGGDRIHRMAEFGTPEMVVACHCTRIRYVCLEELHVWLVALTHPHNKWQAFHLKRPRLRFLFTAESLFLSFSNFQSLAQQLLDCTPRANPFGVSAWRISLQNPGCNGSSPNGPPGGQTVASKMPRPWPWGIRKPMETLNNKKMFKKRKHKQFKTCWRCGLHVNTCRCLYVLSCTVLWCTVF